VYRRGIIAAPETPLDGLNVGAPGTISGVLSNPSGPMSGARAVLMKDGNVTNGLTESTLTAADGSYSFVGLLPGDYVVVSFDLAGAYRSKVVHTVVP